MSMINDALRRASNVTATQPMAEPGAVPPPLPPAASGFNTFSELPPLVAPTKKTSLPLLLLALFLFCAAAAAGIYLWERNHKPPVPARDAEGRIVASTAPAPAPKASKPVAAKRAAESTAPAPSERPISPLSALSTPPPAGSGAATSAPVTFPQLRLQGIYYKPASPSVMINGRTLYVNDQVQGVTVAAIDPSSVTLVLSGRTNVLTLR